MTTIPDGAEVARPFMPAKDFALSKRFYEALGFTKLLDGQVAIFGIGPSSFVLQNAYQKEWAENFMMHLLVESADHWWEQVMAKDLKEKYRLGVVKPPAMQSWGLRVMFLSDPSGVLWHVAETPRA